MLFEEIRPNLRRWTARHPEWRPNAEPDSPADWPQAVGCAVYEAPDAFVAVDPLVPGEDEDSFWAAIDAQVERHGKRVAVLTTIGFHRRSRDEFAHRYGASTSRARRSLPGEVETLPLRGFGETLVWLPEHGALIAGDRLLGGEGGGLRLCPGAWLRYLRSGVGRDELRAELAPLLELPIEMVLVSHGEPVLEGGREALRRALA